MGLLIPAPLIQISNPPYVATCFSKAAAKSPIHITKKIKNKKST
jgi:hypothetical protein